MTYTDLNAPDNNTGDIAERDLWRAVLTQAALDACENAQEAYKGSLWIKDWYAELLCELADIEHSIVKAFYDKIAYSEENRKEAYIRLVEKRKKKISRKRKKNLITDHYVQRELSL